MRWHLLQTFDYIYVVDLHGSAKKKEINKDENVFDIQQWTAIFIGVKTDKKKSWDLAQIFHIDQYGKRQEKYDWLESNSFSSIKKSLNFIKPYYFFTEKDFSNESEYNLWFKVNELFPVNSIGVVTAKDAILINSCKDELLKNVKQHYNIEPEESLIQKISYRPFDDKYIYHDIKLIERAREKIMRNMLVWNNRVLIIPKAFCDKIFAHAFVSEKIIEAIFLSGTTWSNAMCLPLYLYSDSENLEKQTRTPNLDETIWLSINAIVGDTTPEQILDYIYAVLHSPSYREKYKEFLKIDFPRVPYPRDRESFLALVALGGELRSLHLLESAKVEDFITSYPVAGDNVVENVKYVDEKVFINATQYFGGAPESVWTHPIGGYMPAQKWLKDRKGRTLTNDDIMHYQRMIVALSETARIMDNLSKFDNI